MTLVVGEVLRRAARTHGPDIAARLGERTITFVALDAEGDRAAQHLASLGIGRGDRVVWWGDTSLEPLALFVALARIGAVFAPIDGHLGPDEATAILAVARPHLLVTDAAHEGRVDPRCPAVSLPFGPSAPEPPRRALDDGPDSGPDERDPHVIFFTSGSTCRPKGVVLSHRVNCLRTFPGSIPTASGATVCMFPLSHMAGWSIALGCWQQRQAVTFVVQATADALLDAVVASRATRLYAIPAVWARILGCDLSRWDLSCLREADTGTSATPPDLLDAIKRALPWTTTRVLYGSTEAGPGTALADHEIAAHPGSVGRASPGVELAIAGDGEVLVRSDFLMDGYFEDPEASATALAGGWYHTGDLGTIDADGYLSIVGRSRDVIRTGGETVAPAEVEDALAGHGAIAEVAVVGLVDPAWGEVVCAVVVLVAGATLTLDELRAWSADRLSPFKHPRRLEIVDALPRTRATGQVQRTLLAERFTTGF